MSQPDETPDVAALTVQLLSAYLANNSVASTDLADLIRTTRTALTGEVEADAPAPSETFTPAVSVRKSLASSQHIISLIDGKPYKTLKRHLAANGLTPDTYRSRYNLPASYPMVAPDYAAHRRAVAQKVGLGSRRSTPVSSEPQDAPEDVAQDAKAPEAVEAQQPAPVKPATRKAGKKPAQALKDKGADTADVQAPEAVAAVDTNEAASSSEAVPASEAPQKRATRKTGQSSTKPTTPKGGRKAAVAAAAATTDESSDTTQAPEAEPSEADAPSTPAAKPKRRGKIGLFKADAGPAAAPDGAPQEGADAAQASEPRAEKPAPKAKKPRMAREPGKGARGSAASAKDASSETA